MSEQQTLKAAPVGWIPAAEVARRLGVTLAHVCSLANWGALKGVKVYRRRGMPGWWFDPAAVSAYLAARVDSVTIPAGWVDLATAAAQSGLSRSKLLELARFHRVACKNLSRRAGGGWWFDPQSVAEAARVARGETIPAGWLSLEEAAALAGRSTGYLARLARRGDVVAIKGVSLRGGARAWWFDPESVKSAFGR